MTDRLDDRMRAALGCRSLPPAPTGLHERLSTITATVPARSTPGTVPFARLHLVLGLAAVLAGTLLVGLVASGGDPAITPAPTEISMVDGLPVMTVSGAISARDGGALPGGRVAVRGFWSGTTGQPACPPPNQPAGALEIHCVEWYGITELNEQIVEIDRSSTSTRIGLRANGPYLTPWIPPDLVGADLLELPTIDGGLPPVPIVVLGHFNDARANECGPQARQECLDRLVLDRIVQLDGVTFPGPSPAPSVPPPLPTDLTEIDGLPVLTVSEALAAHEDGSLPGGRVAMHGYWTNNPVVHGCVPMSTGIGELEIYCYDGEYGITELDEPIWLIDTRTGQVLHTAQGPHLTPYLPAGLEGAERLSLPMINGQWYPPVPIVVLGHFDDPRAVDCRPEARQLCRDRLVIDRIVEFDPGAVPTPGVTAPPTPFPSALPAGSGPIGPTASP
jgi:hypothetical protein